MKIQDPHGTSAEERSTLPLRQPRPERPQSCCLLDGSTAQTAVASASQSESSASAQLQQAPQSFMPSASESEPCSLGMCVPSKLVKPETGEGGGATTPHTPLHLWGASPPTPPAQKSDPYGPESCAGGASGVCGEQSPSQMQGCVGGRSSPILCYFSIRTSSIPSRLRNLCFRI